MMDIGCAMQTFCVLGATAVRRYVDISGLDPWTMPEFFMPAFIFDHMGDQMTATLETSFADLCEWNRNAREQQTLPPLSQNDNLLRLAEELNGRRVDMTLWTGQQEGKPKEQQNFFALVEFKRGWVDAERSQGRFSDRDKLLMLLEHIDMCPWGIVCGCAPEYHRNWQRGELQKTSDRWFEAPVELPEAHKVPYSFCARVFKRGSDNQRISELIKMLNASRSRTDAPSTNSDS